MSNDERLKTKEAKIDPLVWHYQREQRARVDGAVSWEHTITHKSLDLSFTIRSNFSLVSNACFIDVLVPSTISVDVIGSIFAFVLENAKEYATSGPFELKRSGPGI